MTTETDARLRQYEQQVAELQARLDQAGGELQALKDSDDLRLGKWWLDGLRLRRLYRWWRRTSTRWGHSLRLWRLVVDRLCTRRPRLFATICGNFPIYSQTFVYQELVQLQKHGFEVRHAYSFDLPRSDLHAAFASLWSRRRLLVHDWPRHVADMAYYRRKSPERFEALVTKVVAASGLSREQLLQHHDFVRAFSQARMVEAWRPRWLHSYFFYERSFYALVAGWMLGIPRGISSYADHLLKDYELKVVALHLELCDVVVATSARIKQELAALAPHVSPDKIVVKPNAIDSEHFPVVERPQPGPEWPWRLVCVARIEPKKGLLHLAEAMRILKHERGRRVELHLVGEPDRGNAASQAYAKELSDFCQQHSLWGTVHLEGRKPQTEVRRFLEGSHVFVAPFVETDAGDKDGIPTALLEAMATGIVVVTTDAGSMAEVVTHDVDGVRVPQRDGRALADAIERLLDDPGRRQQLGRAAAARVRSEFDVRVCEGRLHARIDAVLARR